MNQYFQIGYAGSTLKKCFDDEQEEYRVYDKTLTDFFWDATVRYGLTRDDELFQILGHNDYTYTQDGTAYSHTSPVYMPIEEYDDFINDPMLYLTNVFLPRKYPALREEYPRNKEVLAKTCRRFYEYIQRLGRRNSHPKEVLSMPHLYGPGTVPGVDCILSFLRGFTGLSDMRRCPDKLLDAANAYFEKVHFPGIKNIKDASGIPFSFSASLFTPYMTRKQFEKFMWPHYQQLFTTYAEKNGKIYLVMEGNWNHVYDLLNELPKASIIALVEKDDIIETKKTIGNRQSVSGGISLADLKFKSAQECIDNVKRVFDSCAPGGGFLFTQNAPGIQLSDINPENLKAVNEFARDYGKY